MDTSLNAYASEFDKALRRRTKFANFNKDMSHATIIVCTAFRYANERVRLLSNCLDTQLYGGLWFTEELQGFLARGGRLDVLVETDVPENHPVMVARSTGQVTVRRLPDDQQEHPFNFMVVDDIGFRIEYDRNDTEALVAFHHDETEVFKDLKEKAAKWFDNRFPEAPEVAMG